MIINMKYISVITLIFLHFVCFANDAQQQFQEANDAYQAKDYAKAIQVYEALIKAEFVSSDLHYNLGNAYYKNEQLGPAMLQYEKALLLSPKDSDIQHNVEFARSQLVDDIPPLPTFFLADWWNSLRDILSSKGWSIVGLVVLWLGIGGLSVWQLGEKRSQKKQGFVIGSILLLLSALPFGLAWQRNSLEQHSGYAILYQKEISLRSAPDAQSKSILKLHEGTKVALLDELSGWYKVSLVNGEKGWLPIASLKEI